MRMYYDINPDITGVFFYPLDIRWSVSCCFYHLSIFDGRCLTEKKTPGGTKSQSCWRGSRKKTLDSYPARLGKMSLIRTYWRSMKNTDQEFAVKWGCGLDHYYDMYMIINMHPHIYYLYIYIYHFSKYQISNIKYHISYIIYNYACVNINHYQPVFTHSDVDIINYYYH